MLDILCAHIRWTTDEPEYRKDYKQKPSEEIQSLLTLLFVQEHEVFTGRHINLQGSCLNGSNLSQARLEKANLRRAQLQRAHLGVARLQGANLRGAQLQGAHLIRAQLQGADLGVARLQGADLFKAQLQGASSTSLLRSFNEPFEAVINKWIDKESDLGRVIFGGGLTQEDVDSMCNGLSDGAGNELQKKLRDHIRESVTQGVPEDSGAKMGTYTKEDADQWIAEYKTALSAVSESG